MTALINGKANSNHSHNATEITYNSNVSVKQELDSINTKIETVDGQGNKTSLWDIVVGAGAVSGLAGLVADGGLIAAVGTLQEEIALLQTQMAALATDELTGDVMSAIDTAGDVVEAGGSVWKGLKGIANAFSKLKTAAKGYLQISTEAALPLAVL